MGTNNEPPLETCGGSVYEIRLACELDPRWAEWFDRWAVIPQPEGETLLRGTITDQAELHGVLMKIRDLGLKLLAVNCVQ